MKPVGTDQFLTIRRLPALIELGFWNLTIFLLSESPVLQKLVRWGFRKLPSLKSFDEYKSINIRTVMILAGSGIVLGFLVSISRLTTQLP